MKTLALAFLMLPFAAAGCSSSDGDAPSASGAGGAGAAPPVGDGSVSHSGGVASAGGLPSSGGSSSSGGTSSGGVAEDAGNDGDAGAAPCTVTATEVECRSEPIAVVASGTDSRRVYWARPPGAAPSAGFAAVILYQGSFFGPSTSWNVRLPRGTTPFGGDVQVALVATLLEHGFTVVQPEAQGGIAWNTNVGGSYEASGDAVFIPELLARMEGGAFGPVDMQRLYATGISSGGYMTSRMAVSYAGRFRALAIQSGSYATCLGPLCAVPATLPADHPPTLFLHGAADGTVPIATARAYFTALERQRIETRFVEDAPAGHAWIQAAPAEVLGWFSAH